MAPLIGCGTSGCTSHRQGQSAPGQVLFEHFGFTPEKHEKILALNQRYGKWTLFLAWMPVIGDPITIYAGLTRTNFWTFALIVYGGRIARYALIIYAFQASAAA